MTELVDTPAAMRAWSLTHRHQRRRIALVPTMGALHEGHMHLMDQARAHGDVVVASIFVNPLQFNRTDDFERYPRPIDSDLDRCREIGVDAVYAPTAAAMYPVGFQTHVEPGSLADPMEGAGRPGHFRGVTTVVTKLFNAVTPDAAIFGWKDYQQLAIIRRMTIDLDMGIVIIGIPTVREADGVAMSSRNRRLSPDDRAAAVVVPQALQAIAAAVAQGQTAAGNLLELARAVIHAEPRASLEYVEISDADTLESMAAVDRPAVVAIAVWFGEVRLIDNLTVEPRRI